MKVCLIQSNPVMGNIKTNFNWIKKQIISNDADIFIAPELALIGYPPDDLLYDKEFIKKQERAFNEFQPHLKNKLLIIGGVLVKKNKIFNSAFIISQNNIITIQSHEGSKGNKVQTILNALKASKGRTDNLHNSNKSLKRESKN